MDVANYPVFYQPLERTLTTVCLVIVALAMILRTFGRYCLKLKNDRQRINTSGHFLGLDDSKIFQVNQNSHKDYS